MPANQATAIDLKATFARNGWLHLSGALPPALLNTLRDRTEQVCEQAWSGIRAGQPMPDFAFTWHLFKPYLNRINRFHLHADPQTLAILASPAVMDIAHLLCGSDCVMTADMLIVKNRGDDLELAWHQDLIYPRQHQVIAIGIYLDDANSGDGALQLFDNSQNQHQNIDVLQQDTTAHITELPARAGDIVVHDPMLVHGSAPLAIQTQRRTLYYEFRSRALINQSSYWQEKQLSQQNALLQHAMAAQNSSTKPNCPNSQLSLRPNTDISDFYQLKLPDEKANFALKRQPIPPIMAP